MKVDTSLAAHLKFIQSAIPDCHTMHREFRPEDLHHLDAAHLSRQAAATSMIPSAPLAADGVPGRLDRRRRRPRRLRLGPRLAAVRSFALFGRCGRRCGLHRLRGAAIARPRARSGPTSRWRRRRWRRWCSGSRSWRPRSSSSHLWARCSKRGRSPATARARPPGRTDAAHSSGAPGRPGDRDPGARARGRRSRDRAAPASAWRSTARSWPAARRSINRR